MIAAIGQNRELGKANQLLWHLPDDFAYFKEKTLNSIMIMGRKTFESIGRPLLRRVSIVITSQDDWHHEDVIVAHSMQDAVNKANDRLSKDKSLPGERELKDEVFIIGGGEVYRQGLKHASTIYLTEVPHAFPYADTFFPDWDKNEWKEVSRTHHTTDENHEFEFDWVVYEKIV